MITSGVSGASAPSSARPEGSLARRAPLSRTAKKCGHLQPDNNAKNVKNDIFSFLSCLYRFNHYEIRAKNIITDFFLL
jgi:hypothetical protein